MITKNIELNSNSSFCSSFLPQPLSPVNQNGPGIHYFLYHRRANTSQSMQLNQVPRNTNKFVIRGTEFYAKYEFQIQAVNIWGAGPKSPIIYGFSGETRKWKTSFLLRKKSGKFFFKALKISTLYCFDIYSNNHNPNPNPNDPSPNPNRKKM